MADENPASRPLPAKPEPPFDPWLFEITRANALRAYTQSRDEHGHSAQVRARINPALNDLIWHIIRDPGINVPWKSMGDVIRDALVQRISQVAELLKNGAEWEYEWLMRRMEWLEAGVAMERAQSWVSDACEYADRIAAKFIQRDQPQIGARRLRAWLKDLPHEGTDDLEADDPDSDYVRTYVTGKVEELEDMVRTNFRNKKRPSASS